MKAVPKDLVWAIAPARVDWDKRDRDLMREVRKVADKLAEQFPGKRIRLVQLQERIPELAAKKGQLANLPLMTKALDAALRIKKRPQHERLL